MSKSIDYRFVEPEEYLILDPSLKDTDVIVIELLSEPFKNWLISATFGELIDENNMEVSVVVFGLPRDSQVDDSFVSESMGTISQLVSDIIKSAFENASKKLETKN